EALPKTARFTISSRHCASLVTRLAYRREPYEDPERNDPTQTSIGAQPDTMHRLRSLVSDDQRDVSERVPLRRVQLPIALRMAHGLRSRTTHRQYSNEPCARALTRFPPESRMVTSLRG